VKVPIQPRDVKLRVPCSESASLIRKLLDKEDHRVQQTIVDNLELGFRKGDQQIDDLLRRQAKVKKAIEEVREIQRFWYLRRTNSHP
jgi:hypothetical protein